MRLALFLSFFLVFVGSSSVSASQLKRGYKALEIYDYFKAKKLLSRAKKYNPSTATYGLSIIYSRNDNPFYNKDSAYRYVLFSDSTWNTTKDLLRIINVPSTHVDHVISMLKIALIFAT